MQQSVNLSAFNAEQRKQILDAVARQSTLLAQVHDMVSVLKSEVDGLSDWRAEVDSRFEHLDSRFDARQKLLEQILKNQK